MSKASPPNDSKYVAQHFFTDGSDLLARFKLYYGEYYAIKTRRLKSYIDLRMAYECFLKSIYALKIGHIKERKELINDILKFNHNVGELEEEASKYLSKKLSQKLKPFVKEMSSLPVGLRYALDTCDYIDYKEINYYNTVGNDPWIESLYNSLLDLEKEINSMLEKFNDIISGADIDIDELRKPTYNKYQNKNKI